MAVPFKKGNPGKQKGTLNKVTQKSKELFLSIMEGQVEHVEESLEAIRKKDHAKYLDCLSKFFPYFIPKKVEVDTPGAIEIIVKRK